VAAREAVMAQALARAVDLPGRLAQVARPADKLPVARLDKAGLAANGPEAAAGALRTATCLR